jgi:GTP-binding protein
LRHIERNATLLFMIPADSDDIRKDYAVLLNELSMYNPELLDKPRILAITKLDLIDEELKDLIEKELPEGIPYTFISSVTQEGITGLKDLLWQTISSHKD